jgi:hypothetical protein
VLEDRDGEHVMIVPVWNLSNSTLINSKYRKVGNTVCIMYARQRTFGGENTVRDTGPLQGQFIDAPASTY